MLWVFSCTLSVSERMTIWWYHSHICLEILLNLNDEIFSSACTVASSRSREMDGPVSAPSKHKHKHEFITSTIVCIAESVSRLFHWRCFLLLFPLLGPIPLNWESCDFKWSHLFLFVYGGVFRIFQEVSGSGYKLFGPIGRWFQASA